MDQAGMIGARPLPARTAVSAPFWDGLDDHRLLYQQCRSCGGTQFPPDETCLSCGSPDLGWAEASGLGTLYSWTIAHPPLLPYFAAHAPWPVAAIELEEGLRVVACLEGLEVGDYEIGLPVEAGYAKVAEDVTLLVFRPCGPSS